MIISWLGFLRVVSIVVTSSLLSQYRQADPMEESFIVDSKILSEKISVTTYGVTKQGENKAIVYITDGQKMIENGALKNIKKLTAQGKIPNARYVFVGTIDAETNVDKRTSYFFCNDDYLRFFEEELVPRVEGSLSKKRTTIDRSLIGISFGGLNAAYFSAKTSLFQNYALLSPITYPCEKVLSAIAFMENKDLTIFISTGKNDAESYVAPLKKLYISKNHTVRSISTDGGHDFENWNGQLEEVLQFLIRT